MAGLRKHGLHYYSLGVPDAAAGSAADVGTCFTYGGFVANDGTTDPVQYYVLDMSLAFRATQAGQATHYFDAQVSHSDSAGVLKNRVAYRMSANTTPPNATANKAIDLSGAASTYLINATGTTLPWALVEGDTITVARISNDGTGLASVGFGVTIGVGVKA